MQDGQNPDDKADIEIAQDSAADEVVYADGNSYIYKALGWNMMKSRKLDVERKTSLCNLVWRCGNDHLRRCKAGR